MCKTGEELERREKREILERSNNGSQRKAASSFSEAGGGLPPPAEVQAFHLELISNQIKLLTIHFTLFNHVSFLFKSSLLIM
jgi:hypothetical protein